LTYLVTLSKTASKHRDELVRQGYGDKVQSILQTISEQPFPPNSKALKGQAKGLYSVRVNIQDRIVFEIEPYDGDEYCGVINVISMRTHYRGIIPLFMLRSLMFANARLCYL
jgi:Txe/YoeB family toxin of Txe-Axe toxin-antitoxin module